MSNEIKMDADSMQVFKKSVIDISTIIKTTNNRILYLAQNLNQISAALSVLENRMYGAVKLGNSIINMLNNMCSDIESTQNAFINADNQGSNGINSDNYSTGGDSLFDAAVGSKITSALVAASDKAIGNSIEAVVGSGKKVSANEIASNLKKLGLSHGERRNFLRDIQKDARDLEVDIPKDLKLGKGLGVLTAGLTGLAVIDDFKNNKTIAQKGEAAGIDVGMTGISYFVGEGAVALVGTVCAVAAAPEIVTVGAGIATAGLVGVGANWATSKIKGALHLW